MTKDDDEIHALDYYSSGDMYAQTCTRCGVTREMRAGRARWTKTWKFADGRVQVGGKTPPCTGSQR